MSKKTIGERIEEARQKRAKEDKIAEANAAAIAEKLKKSEDETFRDKVKHNDILKKGIDGINDTLKDLSDTYHKLFPKYKAILDEVNRENARFKEITGRETLDFRLYEISGALNDHAALVKRYKNARSELEKQLKENEIFFKQYGSKKGK